MTGGPIRRAERRHLTVLFTDLVGSTLLSRRVDPEIFRTVIMRYVKAVRSCVSRYDGYVARVVGDGVLVYFGWPEARSDAALCSVLAAQDIHAELEALSLELEVDLQCKAAIATGSVIIGGAEDGDPLQMTDAYGEAPNLAAKMQVLAGPGGTVMTRETRELVASRIEFRPVEMVRLEDFDDIIEMYRLFREKPAGAWLPKGAAAIVGRDSELATLLAAWDRARRSEGSTIFIEGDAGIGKSRLVRALRHKAGMSPDAIVQYPCSRIHANSAYYPLIHSLHRWAGLRRGDPSSLKRRKVMAAVAPILSEEQGRLVAALIDQDHAQGADAEAISEYRYRSALKGAYVAIVRALAAKQPLLLHFEDAHWADQSTRSVIKSLMQEVSGLPVLLVISGQARTGVANEPDAPFDRITLQALDPAASRQMIAQRASGLTLEPALIDEILKRSDGVPQFIEACVASFANVAEGETPFVPTSLRDLLQERLDRLGDLRETAIAASVIGCPFDAGFLAAVADCSFDEAQTAIDALVAIGMLKTVRQEGGPAYDFAQRLQRDTAYDHLITSDLAPLHEKVLAYAHGDSGLAHGWSAEFLAYHYQGAGRREDAAREWANAARTAARRFAHQETLSHTSKGLDLLSGVLTQNEMVSEARLNARRGAALRALKGPGALSSMTALRKAFDRAVTLGDLTSVLHVGRSLSVAHHVRAEYEVAEFYARRIETEMRGDVSAQMIVQMLLAMPMIWQGNFTAALGELSKAETLVAALKPGATRQSFESQVTIQRAVAEAFLGEEPKALSLAADAVDIAWRTGRPEVIANVLMLSCNAHQILLNDGTMGVARALQQLANEQRMPFFQASALSFVAAARYNEGDFERGFEELEKGWVAFQATTSRANQMLVCRELARGCLFRGATEDGLRFVEDGIDRAETYQERNYLAEIYRLKGELLERRGDAPEAVGKCYDAAIDTARAQNAALFEKWALERRLALPLPAQEGAEDRLRALSEAAYNRTSASNLRSDGT